MLQVGGASSGCKQRTVLVVVPAYMLHSVSWKMGLCRKGVWLAGGEGCDAAKWECKQLLVAVVVPGSTLHNVFKVGRVRPWFLPTHPFLTLSILHWPP